LKAYSKNLVQEGHMTTGKATSAPETAKTGPKSWRPTTAGTLMIIAGITAVVAEMIYFVSGDLGVFAGVPWAESSANLQGALLAAGLIAVAGGILTVRRMVWWLAVVGVVCSMFFTIWPLLLAGLVSIFLIATSRQEFRRTKFG
jgi:lysylphosphatidylglycerol synthetase-like protein (DUF2156 family)